MDPASTEREDNELTYKVVVNHEEQYSIWPDSRPNPNGWHSEGTTGSKDHCLDHIARVWTDMRPLSLRQRMAAATELELDGDVERGASAPEPASLVERLSQGDHPVEAVLKVDASPAAFKRRLDGGYVHVRFTDTVGGTELGFALNAEASDLSAANGEDSRGIVRVAGDLVLDYVAVRCVAEIDLSTLRGTGHLERLAS
jgi:uncharacterized protein YbdZ (MbtH family)